MSIIETYKNADPAAKTRFKLVVILGIIALPTSLFLALKLMNDSISAHKTGTSENTTVEVSE